MLEEALFTSVEGYANTVEWAAVYGNTGDAYQFNGLEAEIYADSTAKTALTSGGNVYDVNTALTLTHLDNLIDRIKGYRGGNSDQHIILASRNMISRISGLQTRVSRQTNTITYEGGFVMDSYRGVGLLPCDILAPQATTTSPTVTATASAGGSLTDAQRYYAIASVTLNGEQKPGTADDATTATTNNSVTLTWTADADAKLYKIYRGTTSTVADMRLLAVIPAKTYDSVGNMSGSKESWIDDGTLTPNTAVPPLNAGEMLVAANISRNERGNRILGAVSPLGDQVDSYVNYVPLATVNGSYRFMLEGFMALKVPYATTNAVIRRAALA